jgi:hypothetical protein
MPSVSAPLLAVAAGQFVELEVSEAEIRNLVEARIATRLSAWSK